MKIFTNFLISSLLLIGTIQGQQLISTELIQSYTLPELTQLAADNGVPSFLLAPEFEIDFYRVSYETEHPLLGPVVVTGGMAVPKNISCAVPITSYQHGTTTTRTGVPSFQSQESLIVILLASTGYMGIAPDFIGLGESQLMHPYVHAETQAMAVIDMIRATREFAENDPVRLNDQIFLFGYSQGGHATMAAHKKIQEEFSNEMWVTASNPMSGPYDISGVQTDILLSGQPYATPSYLPYLVLGWQSVYDDFFDDPSEIFTAPFDETLPPLFDGTIGTNFINSQCDPVVTNMFNPDLLQDFLDNPDTHFFRQRLRENDVYEWTPESPVRMVYCTGDEQVIYTNAIVAQNYFESVGATNTEAVQLGEGDHADCVTPALLTGIQFIENLTTADNGFVVTGEVTQTSSLTGDISVTIENDPGNLDLVWSTGAEGVYEITDLQGGLYTLTVTDEFGCTQVLTYEVMTIISVNDLVENSLDIFPNPSTGLFNVATPTNENRGLITAYSTDGKAVAMELTTSSNNTQIDLTKFPSGTYLIEYQGEKIYKSRVVVAK